MTATQMKAALRTAPGRARLRQHLWKGEPHACKFALIQALDMLDAVRVKASKNTCTFDGCTSDVAEGATRYCGKMHRTEAARRRYKAKARALKKRRDYARAKRAETT